MDQEETKKFVQDTLGNLGSSNEFDEKVFIQVFHQFDKDKSGTVEKDEMVEFIKEFLDGKYKHLNTNNQQDEAEEDKKMKDMIDKLGGDIQKSYTG